MKQTLDFVIRHGYFILFVSVLVEQMGVPIPSLPMLLAVGALAGLGQLSLTASLLCAVSACLLADLLWYWLGIYKGASILNLLCRISLEPDSCVKRTENMFVRYGAPGLLFAKFVPGLSTAAAPLAGMFRMKIWKFALADATGSFIWAGSYVSVGLLFRNQLDFVAQSAERAGGWAITIAAILLGTFLLVKFIQRQRFYRRLRMSRIDPAGLNEMLERGDSVAIVDLRNALEWGEEGAAKIPGAIHIDYSDIDSGVAQVPLDRDIILYCS